MSVFDHSGVRSLPVRIVDNRHPLPVVGIESLILKPDATILQRAKAMVVIFIKSPSVQHLVGFTPPVITIPVEICVEHYFDSIKQLLDNPGISSYRDALIAVVEIVVVICITDRKPSDYLGRQLAAVPAPLLLGIAFNKLLEDIPADKAYGLLLKIVDRTLNLLALLIDDRLRFCRSPYAPHFREGVHIEWHVVDLAFIVGDRAVDEVVEFSKPIYVVPHFLV